MKIRKYIAISKLGASFLSFLLILTLLFSEGTWAWFTNRYVSPYNPAIEGADFTLDVNFDNSSQMVNLSNGMPVPDYEGLNYEGYEFSISNIGNVAIKVNIKVEVALDSGPYAANPELINFRAGELKYALLLKDYLFVDPEDPTNTTATPPDRWVPSHVGYCPDEGETYDCIIGSLALDIFEFDIAAGEKFDFALKFWIDNNVKDLKNKLFYGRIVIESSQTDAIIVSNTSANAPILVRGMIPIIYNEDLQEWTVIGEWDDRWYNYGDADIIDSEDNVITQARQWANVATVSNANLEKYMFCPALGGCNVIPDMIGSVVPESEITSMFVWIPRFRFAIRSTLGDGNERDINVVWEQGTDDRLHGTGRYQGRTPTDFYTASAFTLGSREIEGFWMNKFEIGNASNYLVSKAGSEVTQNIEDNQWNDRIISSFEENGEAHYGLMYQNRDSVHQATNSEWDAVAFLSQSNFGKYGVDARPIVPNNDFRANITSTNTTQSITEYVIFGGISTQSANSNTQISMNSTQVRSGYVCQSNLVADCHVINNNQSGYVQDPPTDSGSPGWLGGTRRVTSENNSSDSFETNNVYYKDPVFGGNGSTTGNIYGVYDMSLGREEVTNTIFTETRYHPHSSLSNVKTFTVPGGDLGDLYISESGVVYNAAGETVYETFTARPDFGIYEYIIHNTNNFNFDSYEYFDSFYHSYEVQGQTYTVKKGYSLYMLDPSISGYSLFGAAVNHTGANYAYVSRGGSITGNIDIRYNIVINSESRHTVTLNRDISFSPYIQEGGIFAAYSTRNKHFTASAAGNFTSDAGFNITTPNVATASFNVRTSSRAVITT